MILLSVKGREDLSQQSLQFPFFTFKLSFDQDDFPESWEFEALWLSFPIFQLFDFIQQFSTFLISGHKNCKCREESGRGLEMGGQRNVDGRKEISEQNTQSPVQNTKILWKKKEIKCQTKY